MNLRGKTPKQSYGTILTTTQSVGINNTTTIIQDGNGNNSALRVSDDVVMVQPVNDNTTASFRCNTKAGTSLFAVDTSNSTAKLHGEHLNTQFQYFGIQADDSQSYAANTHYPIPVSMGGFAHAKADVDFGTGADPDDTFTTANTDTQYASQIVPMMWYVTEDIYIDSVTSIIGGDNASGDSIQMHLKSFTINSGSTSCLTSGALLFASSTQATSGNEQAYLQSWSATTNSVSSGKVILAFFHQNGTSGNYSVNIKVKYHIV